MSARTSKFLARPWAVLGLLGLLLAGWKLGVPALAAQATSTQAQAALAVENPRVVLEAPITQVTVFRSGARVQRRTLVSGAGSYRLPELTGALLDSSVRVRLLGADGAAHPSAELQSLQVERQALTRVGADRLSSLRAELEGRELALSEVELEVSSLRGQKSMLERCFQPEPLPTQALEDAQDLSSLLDLEHSASYRAQLQQLAEQYLATCGLLRAQEQALEQAHQTLQRLQAELGQALRVEERVEVRLDVLATASAGPVTVEFEYRIPQASWQPLYQVHADRQLVEARLVHRAQVVQESGEDWLQVALYLSTSEASSGESAPVAQREQLSLFDPRPKSRGFALGESASIPASTMLPQESRPELDAAVQDEGLSLRYLVEGRVDVESRPQGVNLRVGSSALALEPEHLCVPELDPTVWLRARCTNDTPWVLLPGPLQVFFGGDYLGEAQLPLVRLGEELLLPLGPDDGIEVKRVRVAEQSGRVGVFSKRSTERERWRIEIRNVSGLASLSAGRVQLVLQESLPRSKHEELLVEAELKEAPALAELSSERWKKLREEQGILTWELSLAPGAERAFSWGYLVSYPEQESLVRE